VSELAEGAASQEPQPLCDLLILSLQIHHEVVAVATKGLPHSVQALASQLASTSKLQLDKVDCNKVECVSRHDFFFCLSVLGVG
jgi:hypothetical protein